MSKNPISQSFKPSNISKFMTAWILRDLWLSMPIFVLYLLQRGITFTQIGIMEALLSLLIVLTDIPSGALADLIGLRTTTGLGILGWACGLTYLGFATDFIGCLIAYLLIGLGDSLLSGAASALFYESLKRCGKEEKLLYYNGRMAFLSAFMLIIASLVGNLLYEQNIAWPFYAHGIVTFISAIIIFSMQEPRPPIRSLTIRNHYDQMIASVSYSIHSARIRYLMIFSTLIYFPVFVFVNIMEQPYMVYIGIPIASFGIVYALTRGVIGFVSLYRYDIEKKLGERRAFYLTVIIFTVAFILMAIIRNIGVIGILMVLFFTRDFSRAIIDKYVNDHIPSEKRATILSIMNFLNNGIYALAALGIGWLLNQSIFSPLDPLIGVIGIFALFCGLIILPYLIIMNKKKTFNGN
jgi:MFS family permease